MDVNRLARNDARFRGSLVLLAATLAALVLLSTFVTTRPSEAQATGITVEPIDVGFGGVVTSADPETRTITITNTGPTTLVIGGVDITGTNAGDFSLATSIDPLNGLSVRAGESVTLDVNFDPATEGIKNALLTLQDLAGNDIVDAPQVTLSGTGVTAQPVAVPADCTVFGTNQDETLTGTPGNDVICGLGGNDEINGLAGNDKMLGGTGNDQITDKAGKDKLLGQGGRDRLNAKDGQKGDLLKGGGGKDRAAKDKKDRARGI